MKSQLLLLAMFIAAVCPARAQDEATADETRRNIDTAMVYAIVADSLCGTAYLKIVIANVAQVGLTLDDVMRRDKPQIDERANRLIADNSDREHKEKFCAKVQRDVESDPDQ